MFVLRDVTVTRGHGDAHVHPLSRVSVEVAGGRTTVLLGPSGAGKSTVLRLLNRLEEPTSGAVLFHGTALSSYDVLALRRKVGLVQQAPVLLTDTVREDLRLGRPSLADDEAVVLLGRAGLGADFVSRSNAGLSGGEAQRVCLARALAVGPEVLLLDEPTSALDTFAATAVERVVRGLVAEGLTAVLVSHDLRQARRLADDAVVLVGGRVVDAGPAERVFADPRGADARAFLAEHAS